MPKYLKIKLKLLDLKQRIFEQSFLKLGILFKKLN